jgi:hypothetical protein
LKIFLFTTRSQNSSYLHETFWHSADLSLYKLWSPRIKVGDKRENYFYISILEKIF